jgi:hypothetical protein
MKTFINATPHDITIVLADGSTRVFPKSGNIARVAQTSAIVETVDGISISTVNFGAVTGLPDAAIGVRVIVSALVKSAAPRFDLVSPGELVRDGNGVVIGAKGFYA